jgi:hypothetical protein
MAVVMTESSQSSDPPSALMITKLTREFCTRVYGKVKTESIQELGRACEMRESFRWIYTN